MMNTSVNSEVAFPSTNSSQQLMAAGTDRDSPVGDHPRSGVSAEGFRSVSRVEWFTVIILCFVNLINYMDRFTIAGVLTNIQTDFQIGDDEGGLLQTAFILSYMICAPLFGYLGDRYSRRVIMAIGVFIWSLTTLLGSFMNTYGWFLLFRAMVGVGEASYSTIAPTIISDLFAHDLRSKMLALFYFAIPVGSGLGYIVGSETAQLAGSWRWALRVTPVLGAAAVVLIFLIREPTRGQSEGSHEMKATTYKEDIIYLLKNKSFMLSTAGFTCVAFVAGALSWWGPKFMHLGTQLQPGNENVSLSSVSFTFGALTMISGVIGVPLGSVLSTMLVKRFPKIDPLICSAGLFLSAPLLALCMILVSKNSIAAYILLFIGEVAVNLNWAINADILLYVVVPTRRSTAEAFQILISHAFGDAGSPYLIGVFSEAIKKAMRGQPNGVSTPKIIDGIESLALTVQNATMTSAGVPHNQDPISIQFQALQYALFTTNFVEVLGAVLFICVAAYIIKDKERANQAVKAHLQETSSQSSDTTTEVTQPLMHQPD
ncbi:protein spinster isoform X1 [Hermetia illucens]|uniref:protein spinster isoform X1 n=1 Tax=Hermetia illucens TaxID=343691 RepID=UPI0018CC551C|nr:protein spinster isoform X1 [Hermetia illucens]